ncbi:MAG: nucleotidyltransferase family protein [Gemmatimonadaceae bacterium]
MITGVVLAAGLARRFGGRKVLAPYAGEPLVRHAVRALAHPAVAEVVAVLPPATGEIAAALAGTLARCVVNERPEDGMSGSLRVALDAAPSTSDALLIALADQPTLHRDAVSAVIEAWLHTRLPIVAAQYRGERGHPVLFARAVWPELRSLRGDRGARDVIDRDPSRVKIVALDMPPPPDIDTVTDLAGLQ